MLIDKWIKTKIGLEEADILTREKLENYQLHVLKRIIEYAKENSKFYNEHFGRINVERDILHLSDIKNLPFTTPEMLKSRGSSMVCVSQSQISRIVTLNTTGSTGEPKRIYFTEEDQELTIDYFHYGLRVMTNPKDVFLVLLPCKTPGSVGDLVRQGLERDGVNVIPFGFPAIDESEDEEIIQLIKSKNVNSLVGTSSVVERLVFKSKGQINSVRTILLSAEYVPEQSVKTIERGWNCQVFEHFGMTETGLGGAMACTAHKGYHPREADLLFEIIDPVTYKVLPEGETGELVFTTLTRTGMPLIRYKTGDTTRWIPEPCPCGSILRRIDKVGDRGVAKAY